MPEDKLENESGNKLETPSGPVKSPEVTEPVKKNSTAEKEKKSPTKKPANKKLPLYIALGVLFLIAVSAIGLAAYDFWLLRAQTSVNTQLANTQSELNNAQRELSNTQRGFETRINQLGQQLQATKNQLSAEIRARKNEQSEHKAVNAALQNITEKLGRNSIA